MGALSAVPHTAPHTSSSPRSFQARFGSLVRSGITAIPNALYDHQATLGLSFHQVGFIGAILRYRWDGRLPYPSLRKISQRCGLSQRSLRRYCRALEQQGLLVVHRRGGGPGQAQQTNTYDFSPLFTRLVMLEQERRVDGADAEAPDPLPEPDAPYDPAPPTDLSAEGGTDVSPPRDKEDSGEEDSAHRQPRETNDAPGPVSPPRPSQVCVQAEHLLQRHGVSPQVARRLARHHSPEQIDTKVQLLVWLEQHCPGRIQNPGAWLHKAIQEDYQPPAGFKTRQEREAEEQARQQAMAVARATQESDRRQREAERQADEAKPLAQRVQARLARWQRGKEAILKRPLTPGEIEARRRWYTALLTGQPVSPACHPSPSPAPHRREPPRSVLPPPPAAGLPETERERERALHQQASRTKLQARSRQQTRLRGARPAADEINAQGARCMAELIARAQGGRPAMQGAPRRQPAPPRDAVPSVGQVLGQVLDSLAAPRHGRGDSRAVVDQRSGVAVPTCRAPITT